MERSEERIQLMNDVIVGISRRSASKFLALPVEDISQTLWLRVLQEENKKNKELTLEEIAEICYKDIIDLQRYEMKRNHYDIESAEDLPSPISVESSVIDNVLIEILLNIFPKDSKERIYIEYWLCSVGVSFEGSDKYYCDGHKYKNGFSCKELAKILGYPSGQGNRSFKKFNDSMKNFIEDFFHK